MGIHKYTNTQIHKYKHKYSNTQIHKVKAANKVGGKTCDYNCADTCRGISNLNTQIQIHKYTNTNTQIQKYKYTKTQIHKVKAALKVGGKTCDYKLCRCMSRNLKCKYPNTK